MAGEQRRKDTFLKRTWRTSLYREATLLGVVLRWALVLVGAVWIYRSYGLRDTAIWILAGVALYNGLLTLLRGSQREPPLAFVALVDFAAVTTLLILHSSPASSAVYLYVFLITVVTLGYGWRGIALSLLLYLAGEYALLAAGTASGPVLWSMLARIVSIATATLILGAVVERHEALRLRLSRASADGAGTGVYDLQGFAHVLENLHKLAVRGKWPYSILVVDISQPGVKRSYKQPGIDEEVLLKLAADARSALRTTDLIGRVGEDVLAIALPDTSRAGAEHVARRLQRQMRESAEQLRFALGLADIEPQRNDPFDKCLHAAFAAAREAGRAVEDVG